MSALRLLTLSSLLLLQVTLHGQESPDFTRGYWQIGFGLGELPTGGSFKPSLTFGYHFSDQLYAGIIYQLADEIQRDGDSFNARSTGLDGLRSARETVSRRLLAHVRYTPFRQGPYLSAGFVFNGRDTEVMQFDDRPRTVAGESYAGTIRIEQTRPAGWGLALGLGYQYHFRNGFSAGFEWTPAWGQFPEPHYVFDGTAELNEAAQAELRHDMDRGFRSSVTNLYKVFHLGLAYRFPAVNP
ncbi:MAG: hypothetical protein KDC54_02590 [Lewinella sp.]|nr:hypothetical protein [Lewinella sp.]